MFSSDQDPKTPRRARAGERAEPESPRPPERDERKHEALRRFGYEPAVIYGLAAWVDPSHGSGSPF